MKDRIKRWITLKRCIVITLLISILLFFLTCVSVHIKCTGMWDDCISVAFFEKQKMDKVDRIILRKFSKESIEITDLSIVKEIASETTISTHANQKMPADASIELYSGDRLIRSMQWSIDLGLVQVCEKPDATHWLITRKIFSFQDQSENEGFVFLSEELGGYLRTLAREAWYQAK